MSRIFSVDSTIPLSSAVAPPDRPLPAPRGTTGTRLDVAQRSTVWTCSVLRGRTTATGFAGRGVESTVLAVPLGNGGVGDDSPVGQAGDQTGQRIRVHGPILRPGFDSELRRAVQFAQRRQPARAQPD